MPPKAKETAQKRKADDEPKAKKLKDPSAPKKPMSAYLLFCNANRADLQKANADLTFGEITTQLAARWKSASDREKKQFEDEALKQKENYNEEKKNYVPDPEFVKAKADAKKAKKSLKEEAPPVAVGRSAWLIFCDENRSTVQAEHEDKSLPVIAALLADQWQSLGASEKARFESLSKAEAAAGEAALKAVSATAAKAKASGVKLTNKEAELKRKEKIKKLKAKAKQLKADIAAGEKQIRQAEKLEAKLDEKREELARQEAKLEDLKPPKKEEEEGAPTKRAKKA